MPFCDVALFLCFSKCCSALSCASVLISVPQILKHGLDLSMGQTVTRIASYLLVGGAARTETAESRKKRQREGSIAKA